MQRRRRDDGDQREDVPEHAAPHLPPQEPSRQSNESMLRCTAARLLPAVHRALAVSNQQILSDHFLVHRGLCTHIRAQQHDAQSSTQKVYLQQARNNLAVDGRMCLCDAASMHAGEPHASREAVNVRTGWQTQHMAADTSHRS